MQGRRQSSRGSWRRNRSPSAGRRGTGSGPEEKLRRLLASLDDSAGPEQRGREVAEFCRAALRDLREGGKGGGPAGAAGARFVREVASLAQGADSWDARCGAADLIATVLAGVPMRLARGAAPRLQLKEDQLAAALSFLLDCAAARDAEDPSLGRCARALAALLRTATRSQAAPLLAQRAQLAQALRRAVGAPPGAAAGAQGAALEGVAALVRLKAVLAEDGRRAADGAALALLQDAAALCGRVLRRGAPGGGAEGEAAGLLASAAADCLASLLAVEGLFAPSAGGAALYHGLAGFLGSGGSGASPALAEAHAACCDLLRGAAERDPKALQPFWQLFLLRTGRDEAPLLRLLRAGAGDAARVAAATASAALLHRAPLRMLLASSRRARASSSHLSVQLLRMCSDLCDALVDRLRADAPPVRAACCGALVRLLPALPLAGAPFDAHASDSLLAALALLADAGRHAKPLRAAALRLSTSLLSTPEPLPPVAGALASPAGRALCARSLRLGAGSAAPEGALLAALQLLARGCRHYSAELALPLWRPEASEALRRGAGSADQNVRLHALKALEALLLARRGASGALREAFGAAFGAARDAESGAGEALAMLLRGLGDGAGAVRGVACGACGHLLPADWLSCAPAQALLTRLPQLAADGAEAPGVRSAACYCVGKICLIAGEAARAERDACARAALLLLGAGAPGALRRALGAAEAAVRVQAAWALASLAESLLAQLQVAPPSAALLALLAADDEGDGAMRLSGLVREALARCARPLAEPKGGRERLVGSLLRFVGFALRFALEVPCEGAMQALPEAAELLAAVLKGGAAAGYSWKLRWLAAHAAATMLGAGGTGDAALRLAGAWAGGRAWHLALVDALAGALGGGAGGEDSRGSAEGAAREEERNEEEEEEEGTTPEQRADETNARKLQIASARALRDSGLAQSRVLLAGCAALVGLRRRRRGGAAAAAAADGDAARKFEAIAAEEVSLLIEGQLAALEEPQLAIAVERMGARRAEALAEWLREALRLKRHLRATAARIAALMAARGGGLEVPGARIWAVARPPGADEAVAWDEAAQPRSQLPSDAEDGDDDEL